MTNKSDEKDTETLATRLVAKLNPVLLDMARQAIADVLRSDQPVGLLGEALMVAADHWHEAPIKVDALVLRKIPGAPERSPLPVRQTLGSSGYDLFYCPPPGLTKTDLLPDRNAQQPGLSIDAFGVVTFYTGNVALMPTGISLRIPPGYEGQIRPRSGLACKLLRIGNSPGTIDSDYVVNDKGQPCEIMVLLGYDGPNSYKIKPGDRIAQIVFASTSAAEFDEKTAEQWPSAAGQRAGGFGSTGSS